MKRRINQNVLGYNYAGKKMATFNKQVFQVVSTWTLHKTDDQTEKCENFNTG